MARHRVIQWGTGAVGVEMLAAVLDDRSDFELVGARVYSDAKHGIDVGVLAGRDPIGVTATTDVDAILGLAADCVLYVPRNTSLDDVCALLESGKNVATTAFLFHPRRLPPADRDRVLRACETGGSTVHGCGINPGNLSGALPLVLSGMSRTIDKVTLQERADWSMYDSVEITFDNMEFGSRGRLDQPYRHGVPRVQQLDLLRAGLAAGRRAERRHRRGHRDRRGGRRPRGPRGVRAPAGRGHDRRTAVELDRPPRR